MAGKCASPLQAAFSATAPCTHRGVGPGSPLDGYPTSAVPRPGIGHCAVARAAIRQGGGNWLGK